MHQPAFLKKVQLAYLFIKRSKTSHIFSCFYIRDRIHIIKVRTITTLEETDKNIHKHILIGIDGKWGRRNSKEGKGNEVYHESNLILPKLKIQRRQHQNTSQTLLCKNQSQCHSWAFSNSYNQLMHLKLVVSSNFRIIKICVIRVLLFSN